MSVVSVRFELVLVAQMPDDEIEAEQKADEISDAIVQAAKAGIVSAGLTETVAVDSIKENDWTSEPYDG